MDCRILEYICKDTNTSHALKQAKASLNCPNPRNQPHHRPTAPVPPVLTPAPTQTQEPAAENARLASMFNYLDQFNARFDKLEQNLQVMNEVTETSVEEHNYSNTDNLSYSPPSFIPSPSTPPPTETVKYVPLASRGVDNDTIPGEDQFRIVIDSGATRHMSHSKKMFDSIQFFPPSTAPSVLLGDDKTILKVVGYGYLTYSLEGKRIRQEAYYIPDLGTTLFSVKQHMRNLGCYFHGVAGNTHIAFPTFIISPRVADEIEMHVVPIPHSKVFEFDEEISSHVEIKQPQSTTAKNLQTSFIQIISKDIKKFISTPTDQSCHAKTIQINNFLPSAKITPPAISIIIHVHHPFTNNFFTPSSTAVETQCRVTPQASFECSCSANIIHLLTLRRLSHSIPNVQCNRPADKPVQSNRYHRLRQIGNTTYIHPFHQR